MAEQDAARGTARKRYPDYEDFNASFVENKIGGSQTVERSAAEKLADENVDEYEEEKEAAGMHAALAARKGQPDAFLRMVASIREVLLRNIRQWQSRYNKTRAEADLQNLAAAKREPAEYDQNPDGVMFMDGDHEERSRDEGDDEHSGEEETDDDEGD
ncbi:hypothetical protein CKM354_000195400 [Cercospora kikuchii]|uniref:Uncharacterized protein n=1 Tax=Cercospora kikuchii TaxID=84275 RepID=A0A9P3F960_9PEZI|nr:uncharacterized protein CKM354_000195400 [Cercospora kikuchii]GIZ38538.1 hypothetical protein CKM354_000195400 [Cercospora kikuchii]